MEPGAPEDEAPERSDDSEYGAAGVRVVSGALHFRSWLRRRHETVELLDQATLSRTLHLDLDLDRFVDHEDSPELAGSIPVPLALLPRTVHTSIEVRAEDGRLLPRLIKAEERRLVGMGTSSMLIRVFEFQQRSWSEEVEDWLWQAVRGEPGEMGSTPPEVASLEPPFGSSTRAMVTLVNETFPLVTLLPPSGEPRRRLTYSYVESLPTVIERAREATSSSSGRWRRVARWLVDRGGRLRNIGEGDWEFPVQGLEQCDSYHLEAIAPEATEIIDAHVQVVHGPHDIETIEDDDNLPGRAHVQCNAPEQPVHESTFFARLYLRPTGIVTSATYIGLFIAFTLVAGLVLIIAADGNWRLVEGGRQNVDAVVSLLVPGIFGTTLAGPSRHGYTAALIEPTRNLLFAASFTSYVAGVSIAFDLHGWPAAATWIGITPIAAACGALLAYQLRRLRRLSRRQSEQ